MTLYWRVGKVLQTRDTLGWGEHVFSLEQEREAHLLFADFNEEDQGRSRVRIAKFENPDHAVLVAKLYNDHVDSHIKAQKSDYSSRIRAVYYLYMRQHWFWRHFK